VENQRLMNFLSNARLNESPPPYVLKRLGPLKEMDF
jgi:hypothetical protein